MTVNIVYLLKTLKTNKLSELVESIEAPQLDINLAIWSAIKNGEIEVDEKKDKVKALKESQPWRNAELESKLMRVFQHYAENEANITRGILYHYTKDVTTMRGYPVHEFLMTLQWMIDEGQVTEYTITVPKGKGGRPLHKFVFLCLPDNPNEEWNSKAVNKWMKNWEKNK